MSEKRTHSLECLDAETLAEYLDRRMDEPARRAVEAHLASCEHCYEAFALSAQALADIDTEKTAERGTVLHGFGRRRLRPLWFSAVALAAALTLVAWAYGRWLSPQARLDRAVTQLATPHGPDRILAARLAPVTPWAPPPAVTRGGDASSLPLATREAILSIERLAAADETPGHLNALGASALVNGDIDRSIDLLQRAVSKASGDAAIQTNLAAAFFQRWSQRAIAEDLAGALNAAEIAVRLAPGSPTAAFNKALAVEALGPPAAAADAWRAYLEVETDAAWRAEAEARLERLLKATQQSLDARSAAGNAAMRSVLARQSPTVLYNHLEDALLAWANAPATPLQSALAAADALRTAGKDEALPGWLHLAAASREWPAGRQPALATVVASRAAALKAIDTTKYSDAAAALSEARAGKSLAGSLALELELLDAQIAYYVRRDPAAIQLLERLAPQAERLHYFRIAARSRQMCGVYYARAGMFTRAALEYEEGLRLAELAGDQDARGSLYAVLGELANEQGQPSPAWEYARLSLSVLPDVTSYRRRHAILSLAASSAEQQRLPGAGLVLATELLRLASESGNPAAATVAHLRRARALELLDHAAAQDEIAAARAASAGIEDVSLRTGYEGDISWNEGFVLRRTQPDRARRALDVALATYEKTGNRARVAETLLVRGEVNARLGRPAEAEQDWLRGLDVFEDQRPAIRDSQLRVSRLSRLWGLYGSLTAARLDRPADALDVLERSRARSLLDAIGKKTSIAPLQGPALYRWLPAGTSALAYSVHDDEVVVFLVDRDGPKVYRRKMTARDLRALVDKHVNAIQRSAVSDASAGLAELLLPPGVRYDPDHPLLILPDGPLHDLPFSTLPVRTDGTLLVQVTQPLVVPSFTVAERLSRVHWKTPHSVVLVAPDAGPASGLPVLRAVDTETVGLRRLYSDVKEAYGAGLRSPDVMQLIADADVIHFAGHAVTDDRYPSQSRLVIEGGPERLGLLPSRIAEGPLREGSLAILVACGTARGSVMRGEGALTLARAFLEAGSASVLGTLWPVDDAPAAQLILDFHRQLRAGKTPAAALAETQRAAAARGQSGTWPAFTVMGGLQRGL